MILEKLAILSILLNALRLGDCKPSCNISVSEPVYAILSNSSVNQIERKSQCALTATVVVDLQHNRTCVYERKLQVAFFGEKSNLEMKRLNYTLVNTSSDTEETLKFCLTEEDWFDIANSTPPYLLKFYYRPRYWHSPWCISSQEDCGRDTNTSLVRVVNDNPPTAQFNISFDGNTVHLKRDTDNSSLAESRDLDCSVVSLIGNKSDSWVWVEVAVHLFDPDVFDELPEDDKFRYSAITSVNVTVEKSLLLLMTKNNQFEVIQPRTIIDNCQIRWNDSTQIRNLEVCGPPFKKVSRSKNYLTVFYRSYLTDLKETFLQALSARSYAADHMTEVNVNVSYKLHASITTGSRRPQSNSFTLCWKLPKVALPERQQVSSVAKF